MVWSRYLSMSSELTSARKPSEPELIPSTFASESCNARRMVPSPPIANITSARLPDDEHPSCDIDRTQLRLGELGMHVIQVGRPAGDEAQIQGGRPEDTDTAGLACDPCGVGRRLRSQVDAEHEVFQIDGTNSDRPGVQERPAPFRRIVCRTGDEVSDEGLLDVRKPLVSDGQGDGIRRYTADSVVRSVDRIEDEGRLASSVDEA